MLVGAPNGVSGRRAFDRWFRYPAGFSPSTISLALERAHVGPGEILVDPFAGSASAGSEVIERGATFVGIEAHPLVAELGALKFSRPGEPSELSARAAEVAAMVELASTADEALLVRRCFEDPTLSWLVGARETLARLDSEPWAVHLKWALLGTLRDVASVKVGWPYQRPSLQRSAPYSDPRIRFCARADMMAADLEDAPESPASRVVQGSSSTPSVWTRAMQEDAARACVTSPPYLNNFDYADATRLEVYFLRQARTWSELCSEIRAEMLVATTQQTRIRVAAEAAERLLVYPAFAEELTPLAERLAIERTRRGRGKEYDRVLAPYFLGVARVLACMHQHLHPGAICAWIVGDSAPYGVYVDTPRLILSLAAQLGYEPGEDAVLRGRGQRWRTNGTRHQVELSERLITFRRAQASEAFGR